VRPLSTPIDSLFATQYELFFRNPETHR
jgi:hypothetical protein